MCDWLQNRCVGAWKIVDSYSTSNRKRYQQLIIGSGVDGHIYMLHSCVQWLIIMSEAMYVHCFLFVIFSGYPVLSRAHQLFLYQMFKVGFH